MADTDNSHLEEMSFTLERQEVPVKLKDPKTGTVHNYVLVELDGNGRDKYLNNLGGRIRTKTDGSPAGVKNFDGLQSNLVARALFRIEGGTEQEDGTIIGGTRESVSEATIQSWPSRVQSALFDRVKAISGLDDEADKKAGND